MEPEQHHSTWKSAVVTKRRRSRTAPVVHGPVHVPDQVGDAGDDSSDEFHAEVIDVRDLIDARPSQVQVDAALDDLYADPEADDPEPSSVSSSVTSPRAKKPPTESELFARKMKRWGQAAFNRRADIYRTIDLRRNPQLMEQLTANPTSHADMIIGFKTTSGFMKPYDEQKAPSENAVASYRLAVAIGLDVIAPTHFYTIGGISGVWSEGADGVKVFTDRKDPVTGQGGLEFAPVDYRNKRTQRGLADLQLFDALTGQFDRHGGNIFIDPKTGQVTGIDEDLSFGAGAPASMLTKPPPRVRGEFRGLPALVDKRTARKVLQFTEENLRKALAADPDDPHRLTENAINQAVARLDAVQKHILALKKAGKLVGSNGWGDKTYQEALDEPDFTADGEARSYLKMGVRFIDQIQRKINPMPNKGREVWVTGGEVVAPPGANPTTASTTVPTTAPTTVPSPVVSPKPARKPLPKPRPRGGLFAPPPATPKSPEQRRAETFDRTGNIDDDVDFSLNPHSGSDTEELPEDWFEKKASWNKGDN